METTLLFLLMREIANQELNKANSKLFVMDSSLFNKAAREDEKYINLKEQLLTAKRAAEELLRIVDARQESISAFVSEMALENLQKKDVYKKMRPPLSLMTGALCFFDTATSDHIKEKLTNLTRLIAPSSGNDEQLKFIIQEISSYYLSQNNVLPFYSVYSRYSEMTCDLAAIPYRL